VPFYRVRREAGGGQKWRAVVVIGAFMAAVTGSEGAGNYGRLKRGELLGDATIGPPWHERRRGQCPWRGGVRGEGGATRPMR
jgi:hypothetical protein